MVMITANENTSISMMSTKVKYEGFFNVFIEGEHLEISSKDNWVKVVSTNNKATKNKRVGRSLK